MNTDLRKRAKNKFEKDFSKLMNNAFFGKTMENVRKHRDIKLVTKEKRRNYLVSEPNYHTTKFFTENLWAIEMKKSVCLGLSAFDVSKTAMYEFWNDYIKPNYGENANFCYMDTDSFICLCKKQMMFTKTL